MTSCTQPGGTALTLDLTDRQREDVLTAACRAPSLHNAQPWAFLVADNRIEIHLDPARRLPVADPDDREARIACAAALFNLRLALVGHGIQPMVSLLPTRHRGALAVVRRRGRTAGSPELHELRQAIPHRRTNRRPFFAAEVPLGHQRLLASAAEAEGALLHVISTPAQTSRVHQLSVAAHATQRSDPAWMAEWNAWTHRVDTHDGVPMSAAGPAPAPQDRWTLRDYGPPGRPDRVDGKDFEDEPLIAVLATHNDSVLAQLHAGQALQRLLLTATVWGMSASFVSQLIEVPAARRQLRILTGGYSHPQVVLRLGFGTPTSPTPRRPVGECLLAP